MTHFELVRTPSFAGAALVRDEALRRNVGNQKKGWSRARVLVVDEELRLPVRGPSGVGPAGDGPQLWTCPATEVAASPPADALLLGEVDGVAYWALRGEPGQAAAAAAQDVRWLNPHAIGGELGALDGALMAAAIALFRWHDRALFCTRDGSTSRPVNAGWARICEAASHEEYPRTDPAVIVLVHDGADRALLGRQASWPAGQFSVLAGFVEAGESLESCVAREVAEEVGLAVTDIHYLGSQSWPFPRSLMVGFHAVADPTQPLRLDDAEIQEAFWASRDELRTAAARGDWSGTSRERAGGGPDGPIPGGTTGGAHRPPLLLPGRISIARNMIDSWLAAG